MAWRRGEVFKLERRHVNLADGHDTTGRPRGSLTLDTSKNGEPRKAYLPADLREALAAHLARVDTLQHRLGRVFRRVFVYTEGNNTGRSVGVFRKAWRRACRLAGRPGAIVHDLRRSGIRAMVRSGIRETVAMRISGHKTRSVFDRYNITSGADLQAAAEALGMTMGITGAEVTKTRSVTARPS